MITFGYSAPATSPLSLQTIGGQVLARMDTLNTVDVQAVPTCGASAALLRRYQLNYLPDADTQQLRLSSVQLFGRQDTAENGTPITIATYGYGTASTGGKLVYQSAPAIPVADAYPLSSTELNTSARPTGYGYVTSRSLTDVTGDGRPDRITTGTVARNTPTGPGGSAHLGGTGGGDDAVLGMNPFESRTTQSVRYQQQFDQLNDDMVWRQAIDFDGDGRVDLVDASEQPGIWAVYLNTPDPANPRNIVWVRRAYSTTTLAQYLRSKRLWTGDDSLPLALRTSGSDRVYNVCAKWNSGIPAWVEVEDDDGVSNGCPPGGTLKSSSTLQRTITQWEVKDINGDGYPDVVFNAKPVVVDGQLALHAAPQHPTTKPVHTTRTDSVQIEPGVNDIYAVFNIIGVHLSGAADSAFSAPVILRSNQACGVNRWESYDASSQQHVCDIVDVNGDGVADLVNGTSVFLGTGSRGTNVFFTSDSMLTLPDAVAWQGNNVTSACALPATVDTTFSVYQFAGLRDLNGDGIPDYVKIPWASMGTGTGFAPAILLPAGFAISSEVEDCGGRTSSMNSGLYDLDGDGKPDLLSNTAAGPYSIGVMQLVGSGGVLGAPEAGRLVQIDNGFGALTKITYRSAKNDATTLHQVPFPEIVVSSVETVGTQGFGGSLSATLYAYGGAMLVFDPALDTFTFPGYQRSITLRVPASESKGLATITDTYAPATNTDPYKIVDPNGGPYVVLTAKQRYDIYMRTGRVSDVTVLSGDLGADPWVLLSTNVASDARRIAGTHYEWDTRLLAATSDPSGPEMCSEMVLPYDYTTSTLYSIFQNTYDVCTAHGFAFGSSVQSWRGEPGAAPPSTANVVTRSEVRSVDSFGRTLTVAQLNDLYRDDDDICVDTTYANPTGSGPRVLSAVSQRRVSGCSATTYASDTWEYDGLVAGNVSTGFPTAHIIERRDDLGNSLGTIREFGATYDAVGNRRSTTTTREDGATRTVTVTPDPFGLVPVNVTTSATGVPTTQIAITPHPLTLATQTVTDENGTQHAVVFDGFERTTMSTVTPPGGAIGALSSVTYIGFTGGDSQGRHVVQKVFADPVDPQTVDTAVGRTSTVYLDELGRGRRTDLTLGAPYPDEFLTVGARRYDSLGRVVFQADPYPSSQTLAAAYGTTQFFNPDGTPSCSIRGNGQQPPPTPGTTPSSNELQEAYPTCFYRVFQNHAEVVSTRDAASLLGGSPQYNVLKTSYATAIGQVTARSTWQGSTRLEHAAFTYDRLGRQSSMTRYRDAASGGSPVASLWHFDSLGQVLELDEPDSVPQLNTYSNWGERLRVRRYMSPTSGPSSGPDGSGPPQPDPDAPPTVDIVSRYDALGRLTHREEQNNGLTDSETVNDYLYDQVINAAPQVIPANMLGRLAQATSPTGSASFSYDALGRVDARVFTDNHGGTFVEKHKFHADGTPQMLDLFLPDTGYADEHVDYVYDLASRGRSVTYTNGASQALFAATTIDPFGRVREATYGAAGYSATYADVGRRFMSQATVSSPSGSRSVSYQGFDPVGRERSRNEVKNGAASGTTTSFVYDALGRLSSAVQASGSLTAFNQQFTYDPLGNILGITNTGTASPPSTTISYLDTDRDRICQIAYGSSSGPGCNVTYDDVGNIVQQPTRSGVRQLSYLADGRTRSVTEGNTVAHFRYDAFGDVQELDVTSDVSPDARNDRHYGAIIGWRLTPGTTSYYSRRIPGFDGSMATRRGPGGPWVFEFGEARGNRFFTDETGAFVQDVDYLPYGETKSSGAQPGSLLYSTEQWNGGDALAALGVSQLGARLYDPAIGRFLSRDPLLIPRTAATTNPYAFAENDPVNSSDPSGLSSSCPEGNCDPLPALIPNPSWFKSVGKAIGDGADAIGNAVGDAAGAALDWASGGPDTPIPVSTARARELLNVLADAGGSGQTDEDIARINLAVAKACLNPVPGCIPAPTGTFDPDKLMRALDWDPNGPGKASFLGHWGPFKGPYYAWKAASIGSSMWNGEAYVATEKFMTSIGYVGRAHNDFVDAFRHAYASYRLTQELGADMAKELMDLHERTDPNPWEETAMDLWNNAAGRSLALRPANNGRDPTAVITEALDKGLLMTHVFSLTNHRVQEPY